MKSTSRKLVVGSGDARKEYVSYKRAVVLRTDNLLLPLSFVAQGNLGKEIAFSKDASLFVTVDPATCNIRIHGKKTAEDSGSVSFGNGNTALANGKTYNLSVNTEGKCQVALQSTDGSAIVTASASDINGATVAPSADTAVTTMIISLAGVAVGDAVDFMVSPMLVEGTAVKEFAPYYKQVISTSTQLDAGTSGT